MQILLQDCFLTCWARNCMCCCTYTMWRTQCCFVRSAFNRDPDRCAFTAPLNCSRSKLLLLPPTATLLPLPLYAEAAAIEYVAASWWQSLRRRYQLQREMVHNKSMVGLSLALRVTGVS